MNRTVEQMQRQKDRWNCTNTDRMDYGHLGYSVGQTDRQKDRWMDIKMGYTYAQKDRQMKLHKDRQNGLSTCGVLSWTDG